MVAGGSSTEHSSWVITTNLVGALSKNWLRKPTLNDLCAENREEYDAAKVRWRIWTTNDCPPAYGNEKIQNNSHTALQPGRSYIFVLCIYPKLKATNR
jgi:hypothetical protein